MTGKRAVVYARVSTARQAREELPIASQLQQCYRKSEQLGATVIEEFTDEGISGTRDTRPGFQACIDYCERLAPDYLVCWSTSRFARNRIDAAAYKLRLRRAGVRLVWVSMDIDADTDGGWLTEGMMELMDEYLSRSIASDTVRSMIRNAEQGYWNGGHTPFGFRVEPATDNPRRRRLVPDENEAPIVQQMFALRLEGHGGQSIAHWLNDRGLFCRGQRWHKRRVVDLLRNELMAGRHIFNRRDRDKRDRPRDQWIIIASHQPLIAADTWQRVQDLIDAAAQPTLHGSPHSTRPFTGILQCGDCGRPMQIETAKGRSRRYVYYRCHSARRGMGCESRRIRADLIDRYLIDLILSRVITPELIAEMVRELHDSHVSRDLATSRRRATLTRQMQKLEVSQSRLFDILETHGADTPNLGDLTQRLRANKHKIATLQSDISDLAEHDPFPYDLDSFDAQDIADTLADVIRTSDGRKLRSFLSTFIDGVTVNERDIEIRYRPETLMGSQQGTVKGGWLPGSALHRTPVRVLRAPLPERLAA